VASRPAIDGKSATIRASLAIERSARDIKVGAGSQERRTVGGVAIGRRLGQPRGVSALIIAAVAVFAALVCVIAIVGWYFSADELARRKLSAAPLKKIRDVSQGELVKIVGRIEPHAPVLTAPLSGRSCSYFEAVVEERVSRKNSTGWRVRIRETDVREFFVVDGTGRALVEVANAHVVAVQDHHQSSGTFDDASPELEAYLARHGESSTGLLGFNKTLRYREAVLELGEEVAVLGRARWEIDPHATSGEGAGYRGGAKRLVLEAPETEGPLLVSDEPGSFGRR
jgi:hypothetical protein